MTDTPSYTSAAVSVVAPTDSRYGGMQMLVIEHETAERGRFDRSFSALFNPTQLSTETAIAWTPKPAIEPTGGAPKLVPPAASGPTSLALELFFDTSLRNPADGSLARASASLINQAQRLLTASDVPSGTNVLALTSRVFALSRIVDRLRRPPLCRLWWGRNFIICGVLTRLQQDFQRFHPDGTPIRARLACTFTEHSDPAALTPALPRSAKDVLFHRVVRGDTLSRLAATYLGDATAWRLIAGANAILDPLKLVPGRVLMIPKRS